MVSILTFNGISVLRATVVGYQTFDRAALFRVISAQSSSAPGTPQPKSFVFTWAPRAGLNFLAIISTLALVLKSKGLSASTTIKGEGYTLNDCERISKLKGMPGSTTIKQTARKYNSQKYCKVV